LGDRDTFSTNQIPETLLLSSFWDKHFRFLSTLCPTLGKITWQYCLSAFVDKRGGCVFRLGVPH
jgi:hypothetical protein